MTETIDRLLAFEAGALPDGLERGAITIDKGVVHLALQGRAAGALVEVDLMPLRGAPREAVRTAKFALVARSSRGVASPQAVLEAVAAHLRGREDAFRWAMARPGAGASPDDLGVSDALRAADDKRRAGDIEGASKALDDLVAKHPARGLGVVAAYAIGATLEAIGRKADATPYFSAARTAGERAVTGALATPSMREAVAAAQAALGDPAAAEATIRACVQEVRRPRSIDETCTHAVMAGALERRDERARAAQLLDADLDRLAALGITPPKALYIQRAALALAPDDAAKMLSVAQAALRQHADDDELVLLLAQAQVSAGRPLDAIRTLEPLVKRNAAMPGGLLRVVDAFLALRVVARTSHEAAASLRGLRDEMSRRASVDAKDVMAIVIDMAALYDDESFERVIERSKALEAAAPREVLALVYRSAASLWMGDEAAAVSLAEKARTLNSASPDALYALSLAVRDQDPARAATLIERYERVVATRGAVVFRPSKEHLAETLAALRAGKALPRERDRPSAFGQSDDPAVAPIVAALVAVALAAGVALVLVRRRREAA